MKVVLVIEEPNECIDCPCYRQTKEDGELFEDCKAMMKPLNWREVTEKPSWCPLKPISDPKSMTKADHTYDPWEDTYRRGYNACLDEIVGETE